MFDKAAFFDTLSKVFRVDATTLTEDTDIHTDLGATSQTLFTMSALLERMTGKKVNYADINVCDTLGQVLALVGEA